MFPTDLSSAVSLWSLFVPHLSFFWCLEMDVLDDCCYIPGYFHIFLWCPSYLGDLLDGFILFIFRREINKF